MRYLEPLAWAALVCLAGSMATYWLATGSFIKSSYAMADRA